jgi:selenoprotein W-related protein
VSLANDLLKNYEPEIESLVLVPSDSGRYEIIVNDRLVYSKLQTGRHAEPDEILGLVRELTSES